MLCTQVDSDYGGTGRNGSCAGGSSAWEDLCVDSYWEQVDQEHELYVLAGLVPGSADSIRVTLTGDMARMFPLTGPVVSGTAWRVLMLELGPCDWRKVEVFHDDQAIASRELPPTAGGTGP